jgi:malonate transporter and related proteins
MVSSTLSVLLAVLFVVALGYAAGRTKEFDADQVAGINELVLDFALPASLFVGMVTIPRAQLVADFSFVLVVVAALVGMYLIAFLVARVLRLSSGASALFALGAAFPGAPFFGPAVLGGLFGLSSTLPIALVGIVGNLLLAPASTVVLEVARRSHGSALTLAPMPIAGGSDAAPIASGAARSVGQDAPRTVILRGVVHAVQQPYVWAPAIGLVLVVVGVHVPSLVDSMLNLIGQTTSGVALFASGLTLAAYAVKLNSVVGINAALKSMAQPALMLVLLRLAGTGDPLAREGAVATALPAAVIAVMLAARYKTYQSEAGSNMVLTVILMMAVVPLFTMVIR